MKSLCAKIVSRCASLLIAATAVLGASAANAYDLGGVGCATAPSSAPFYCYGGGALLPFRAAVADPANFGPAGVVSTAIVTTEVNMSRVYNWDVKRKRASKDVEATS